MKLSKGLLLLSTFLVTSCLAVITIETFEPDKSRLVEAVVHILESCYPDRITAVGLAGSSSGMISRALWSQGHSPVTLIDATSRIIDKGPVRPQARFRLNVFVVTASSSTALTQTLRAIKTSVWWNHMAAFLLIDWSFANDGCTTAFEMLWAVWQLDILNAKLLCHNLMKERVIYTFNPYTSQAPDLWTLENIYSGKNDHPWTLFVRGYEASQEVCNELDFKKTNDLGGDEILISVMSESYGYESTVSDRICVGLYEESYCKLVGPALNATLKALVHTSSKDIGYVDDKGKPSGILAEVMDGTSDVSFISRYLTSLTNVTFLYPHWLSELRVVTQYSGYKSQLRKICSVVDSTSRIGLCLVCLINILFFKYMLREPAVVSCLSAVRIICNASLLKIPRILSSRIYLASLFLFVVTMQGIFQGKLSSLLTNQDPLRNVNSKEDLAELGHTVYGFQTYGIYFNETEFERRFVGLPDNVCTEKALEDPKNACVNDMNYLLYDVVKYKLHLSHESIINIFAAFPLRPDCPLEETLNEVIQRGMESYVLQYLYNNLTRVRIRNLEIQRTEYAEQGFQTLTLDQLTFAFIILAIGLVCASVIFVIEIMTY